MNSKQDITEAKFWLNSARKSKDQEDVSSKTSYVREYTKRAGMTLKEIGTSEEELKDLEKQSYITETKYWLSSARKMKDKEDVSSKTNYVREYAQKAGIALKDIGISEEELKNLEKQGYIAKAKYWLEKARKGLRPDYAPDYTRDYVKKAGITLEEIGTSEDELQKITA